MNHLSFAVQYSAAGEHSAPVTHIGQRILWTVVTLAMIAFIYYVMWHGWKSRQGRQSDIPPLPTRPGDFSVPDEFFVTWDPIEAVYVSTTAEGDWLDRIAVHGLGVRSEARIAGGQAGIWIEREDFGAPDIFIPSRSVLGVRLSTGMAGKFLRDEGLVVITWQHGDHTLDTGLMPRHGTDELIRMIEPHLAVRATERPSA